MKQKQMRKERYNDLFDLVKDIVAEHSDSVLSNAGRVSSFFKDLAQDVPKPRKNALIKCLEQGFAQIIKNVTKSELANCKQHLTQRLHKEEGLDLGLCEETLELLTTVLLGKAHKPVPIQSSYKVIFHVKGGNGTLEATDDSTVISSGDDVQQGKNIVFTAKPNSGYSVKKWKENNIIISGNKTIYSITNLSGPLDVTVKFEKIKTQPVKPAKPLVNPVVQDPLDVTVRWLTGTDNNCGDCGSKFDPDDNFCGDCGGKRG